MQAHDIMTTPVITVSDSATLPEAVRLMIEHHVSGLPVVDRDGRLVGMLSEGDLLRRAELGTDAPRHSLLARILAGPGMDAADYVHANSRRVADLMSPCPIAVSDAATLDEIVSLFEQHRIKRTPIVRNDRVVGLVSRHDLLREIDRRLQSATQPPAADDAILNRLHAELDHQPWFKNRQLRIRVERGIVHLEGIVDDDRMRQALIVAAQNASGRAEVDADLIVLVDPLTLTAFPIA